MNLMPVPASRNRNAKERMKSRNALLVFICASRRRTDTSDTYRSHTRRSHAKSEGRLRKECFSRFALDRGETGEGGVSPDGRLTVPRETNQAISYLDIDAQTKEDQPVVKVLSDFFLAKTTHNTEISTLFINVQSQRRYCHESIPDTAISESQMVVAIHSKEAACSEGLEAALRARSYRDVEACFSSAQIVPGRAHGSVSELDSERSKAPPHFDGTLAGEQTPPTVQRGCCKWSGESRSTPAAALPELFYRARGRGSHWRVMGNAPYCCQQERPKHLRLPLTAASELEHSRPLRRLTDTNPSFHSLP
jgi:hypothetical protein